MFGYKKEIKRKLEKMEELDSYIEEKYQKLNTLELREQEITVIINRALEQFPGIDDVLSFRTYIESLKEEIESLEIEIKAKEKMLKQVSKKLKAAGDILSIEEEKRKIEKEKLYLQAYKKNMYSPGDVIIAAYKVPNIDDIAIDAFVFEENDEDDIRIYLPLSEDGRVITMYDGLHRESRDYHKVAILKQFVTFEEACLSLGSDLYLRDKVSAQEINEILKLVRSGFVFIGENNISMEEFMKILLSGKAPEAPIRRLLEKGEPK